MKGFISLHAGFSVTVLTWKNNRIHPSLVVNIAIHDIADCRLVVVYFFVSSVGRCQTGLCVYTLGEGPAIGQ